MRNRIAEAHWNKFAHKHGLRLEWLGQFFSFHGTTYRILGMQGYNVLASSEGREFSFTTYQVKDCMEGRHYGDTRYVQAAVNFNGVTLWVDRVTVVKGGYEVAGRSVSRVFRENVADWAPGSQAFKAICEGPHDFSTAVRQSFLSASTH